MEKGVNNLLDLRVLDDYINKLVEKKVNKILDSLGVECSDYSIVREVTTDDSGNVTSARVETSTGNVVDLVNESGKVLAVGDTVKMYGSRKNLANRYIGLKCKGEETVAETEI